MHYVVRMQSLGEFGKQFGPPHTHTVLVTAMAVYILLTKIEFGPDIYAAAVVFKRLVLQSLVRDNATTGNVDNDELRGLFRLDEWGVAPGDVRLFKDPLVRCALWEAFTVTSLIDTVTVCFASLSLLCVTASFASRSLPFPVTGPLQYRERFWQNKGARSSDTSSGDNGRQPS